MLIQYYLSFNYIWLVGPKCAAGLVEQSGVPHVVHIDLGWTGQRMAIPVCCIRERWWCIPNSVHRCVVHYR